MKLSDIVAYRNRLSDFLPEDTGRLVELKFRDFMNYLQAHQSRFPQELARVNEAYDGMGRSLHVFQQTVQQVIADLNTQIQQSELHYFAESYSIYENEIVNDPIEYILQRTAYIDDYQYQWIYQRVQLYSNWRRPGMVLRPSKGKIVEQMVDCYPLYLVDQHHDLLLPVKERFNEKFNRRLGWYAIPEEDGCPDFSKLPNDQFGLIVAATIFHFKPLEVIKQYLLAFWEKLGPGGVVGLTFNDCDYSGAVELAESKFMCYTPGRIIKSLVETLGFEIIQFKQLNPATSWLEMRKPGEWQSIKANQCVAEIIDKNF